MMVGEGVDEELSPEEDRPVEEWPPPPPSSTMDLSNKDGSSRLLFLTVQYVGDEAHIAFEGGLDSFAELEQRVVSPLDPNMGCTACYSPVYRPPSPLMPAPVSPTANYLDNSAAESGMIVLGEQCSLEPVPVENYNTVSTDDAKLLILSSDPNNPTEMVVTEGDPCGDQRVQFVLSNGTVAYGIVEPPDANGARVIQIPTEYLVAARAENAGLPTEVQNIQMETVQDVNTQDDTNNLRAIYNTLKEQGLIIESGDLRLEPDLEPGSQVISVTALMEQEPSPMEPPLLQSHVNQVPQSQVSPPVPLQKRFWCEECNMLLESDCRDHQINRKISDKHVPSRARATLPASYLIINKINDSEEGVFARKTIPKRTQFGPIEGLILKPNEISDVGPRLELTIETASGELNTLDVSNEHMSNWMRFVRMATTEKPPNLLLSQLGLSLYFTTTHMIHAKEELLVWYSPSYALRRNLPPDPPPPEWPCLICGVKLKTSDELTKHALHHQKKKREENLTVYTLRRKNKELIANVKKDISDRNNQATRKMRFECVICSKKFPQCFSLKRHIYLLHTRENKYHCKICHLGFSHSFNRLRHMRKVHPHHKDVVHPKTTTHRYECWSCSHCDLTFNSASMLNLHTLVHAADNIEETEMIVPEILPYNRNPQELVSCPQCSLKFSNKRKLANHVAEHGKNRDPSDKKFHCEICGRNFISAVRFQSHKDLHNDDANKPLQCHVCMKRLSNKSALSCHLKIHDWNVKNERPGSVQWECPMCKQLFGNVLALRSHVHTHAVQGFYYCPHCEKSFEEYSGIRKHIRSFHSARKHICTSCDKRFPTQDKLRMHQLKHSDDRQFLCDDCGKQFKRNDKLKEHMKRMHKNGNNVIPEKPSTGKKIVSKIISGSTDYERYIYKCHSCLLGFKRRGMLVNHLANRHPDITPDSVPELNLPILKTTRDYYCQYCDKIYKSSSKRKAHILKNHPGLELPMSNRQKGGVPDIPGLPNPTFSQTVGSITTNPHGCQWCHKQYASKAKLLQHQRKKHAHLLPHIDQAARLLMNLAPEENIERGLRIDKQRTINLEDIAEHPQAIPITLSTNINNSMLTDNQMHEYEIIATDVDGEGLILSETPMKRPSYKNDNISSDLLSQAMSEIGVNLSELRALSSEQCLKLLGGPCEAYTPYPAR